MKKYTYKIDRIGFEAPNYVDEDPAQSKILNESIEEIRIIVNTHELKDSLELALEELKNIVNCNYRFIANIEFYKFGLKLIQIECA